MQLSSIITTILLAVPAVVTAAPITDSTTVSAANIFVRQATCNPVFSEDPAQRAKQEEQLTRMRDLTVEYHAAESSCPSTALVDFDKLKKKQKDKALALRQKCIDGYAL